MRFTRCKHIGISSHISDAEEGYQESKFPTDLYEHLEGRNYCRKPDKKSYFLPCDDEEIDRLEINHLMFRSLFGRIYFPPIEDALKEGIKVLNVKSGPGFWMKEMAQSYPNSHFTGTDIIIYPISHPPRNCHFHIANAARRLPFDDNTFDFVVQHDAVFLYTQKEWKAAIDELVRVTKPGGWIQLVEPSGILQDIGPSLSIWLMRITVSLQTRDILWKIGPKLHEALESHQDIDHIDYSHRSIPLAWLGKLGDIGWECMERLLDSLKPRLCDDWSMTHAKYDKVVQAAAKECHDFGTWTNIHYVIGRKRSNDKK
ncbi:hypothetical protein LRAMOSA11212 [Lichtheimia ramosa]|uniref:Methyltransferase domain-containing protein n=1 Tax=Lichtheimia ramosa TaxID=688394 RepID=A0A077WT09_9FUNG|nr:hypothetical protein LRAMOSA11212 [Lichtheimia ramosa]